METIETSIDNNVQLSETKRLDNIIFSNRRKMMALAGTAFAGLALSKFATKAQAQAITDADILNFALNLEYLEAQYYTLATAGVTIDKYSTPVSITGGGGTVGTVTTKGGNNYASCLVPWGTYTTIQAYAAETAKEERNHVAFLSSALGSAAVPMPNIDLLNSFNGLAVYAGIGPAFDPFANPIDFLLGSFIFEDVGVTAYSGAAPLISDPGNLSYAAGIQAVEAYHAGLVRTVLFGLDAATPSAGIAATASKIAAARAKLDGTNDDDIGLGTVTYANTGLGSTIVDCDSNSLVFARTTTEVLSIVYAGGAAGVGGGFFPSALNGTIK
jgi:hypothetical protein